MPVVKDQDDSGRDQNTDAVSQRFAELQLFQGKDQQGKSEKNVIRSKRQNSGRVIPSNPCETRFSRSRQARYVLHGTAKTFDLHSKAPQRIDGNHATVGIEGNHVGKHAAKGKGFRGLA